jgi:hypothetical protein
MNMERRMIHHRLLAASLGMLAVFCCQRAAAFWVFPDDGSGHQTITRDALSRVQASILPVGHNSFESVARQAIVSANKDTDNKRVQPYSPVHHFDNEEFRKAANHLIRLRSQIVLALMRGDQARAWNRLGMALHGIQDFYAHSTWIERRGNANTAAHYDLFESNDAARARKFLDQLRGTPGGGCLADAVTPNASTTITSGYYPETSITNRFDRSSGIPFPSASADPMKCLHLGATVFLSPCSVVYCFEPGVEKDFPTFALHADARLSAQQASIVFVQDLITELEALKTAAGNHAVCSLLGRPSVLCAVPTQASGDGVYFLRNLCVYSVSSYYQQVVISSTGTSRQIAESHQPQHSCIESNTINISVGNLFCKKDGAWVPKTSISTSNNDNNGSADVRTITVTEDGTFTGLYTRVTGPQRTPGWRIFDFRYFVQANDATQSADTVFNKKDAQIIPTSTTSQEWFGMGSSTLANPGAGFAIDLVKQSSIASDQPLPAECADYRT